MNSNELSTARKTLGLTSDELAKALNVRGDTVRKWESGAKKIPENLAVRIRDVAEDRMTEIRLHFRLEVKKILLTWGMPEERPADWLDPETGNYHIEDWAHPETVAEVTLSWIDDEGEEWQVDTNIFTIDNDTPNEEARQILEGREIWEKTENELLEKWGLNRGDVEVIDV